MPAEQKGQIRRHGSSFSCRYYDEHGIRRYVGGFASLQAAQAHLDQAISIVRLRRATARGIVSQRTDGIVYLAHSDLWKEDVVKIGFTEREVEERMIELRASAIFAIPADRDLEVSLLREFAPGRRQGEFVHLTAGLVERFAEAQERLFLQALIAFGHEERPIRAGREGHVIA